MLLPSAYHTSSSPTPALPPHQFLPSKNTASPHPLLAESPVLGNHFNSKSEHLSLKGDDRRHYDFNSFDFFASNCDPESEVYYTSNDAAHFEYPLDLDERYINSFNHHQYCYNNNNNNNNYNNSIAFNNAHPNNVNNNGGRLVPESFEQESSSDDINPMIVFESYCIPQNFFDGKKQGARERADPLHLNEYYRRVGKFQIKGGLTGRVIEKSQDYDKNICRYIARLVIRQFNNEEYTQTIVSLTKCDLGTLEEAREIFLQQIENISGHRAFRELLISQESDSQNLLEQKFIFQSFTKWFLRERAVRYIIQGDMKDQMSYIRYQNDIMLYYIDCPQKWESNQCSRQRRLVRNY